MRKLLSILLILCFGTLTAYAQSDESLGDQGSIYSRFGLGQPVNNGSSSADGLGLWGVSYNERFVPGYANPAQWGSLVYATATGGIGISNFNGKDNFGQAKHSLIAINKFQLELPIYKNKLGFSASFAPYTRLAYQGTQTGSHTVGSGPTLSTVAFQTQTTSKGGVDRLEFGLGWKINSTFSVGYAASVLFTSIDNNFVTAFNDSSFQTTNFTLHTHGEGFGNRIGVFASFPGLFSKDDQLSAGATINLPVHIDAKRTEKSDFVTNTPDRVLAKGQITTPLGVTAGLTYAPSSVLSITTEGLYQQWSDYKNSLKSGSLETFTDRVKIGAGIRFFPFSTGSNKFFSRFKYRLGASYDTGNLEIKGQKIQTIMLAAGLGIPAPHSNSSIDISVQYGIRGTKAQNLVKENVWSVKLSLNLAELFFFRPKLR